MQLRRNPTWAVIALALVVLFASDANAAPAMRGIATYYPGRAAHLQRGEFSAAHKTLPFGTRVRVKEITTGRTVLVRINDPTA